MKRTKKSGAAFAQSPGAIDTPMKLQSAAMKPTEML